ncbi:MAG: bifunctional adenosylcobinamide kinase/adenosylcobinamide-phosphate guanylyltransferase [Clostridia bacterium]|nr:bifunctional adenosylcobinamide kinase/adenosylcobinamide-phosphate guanylyltransferase [Clostridia bacterium]
MLILLTGGSACGKSSYGETLAVQGPKPLYYIAAMEPYDEECLQKIARHRALRANKGFETVERYTGVDTLKLPETGGTVLLECLCNLTANEMYIQPDAPVDPVQKVVAGVENLMGQTDTLIVITNDVGSDDEAYSEQTRAYIRALGEINARVAAMADRVYELVAGIPICLKGETV